MLYFLDLAVADEISLFDFRGFREVYNLTAAAAMRASSKEGGSSDDICRSGVAGAFLQTASLLSNLLSQSVTLFLSWLYITLMPKQFEIES